MLKESDIERYLIKQSKSLGALCFKWTSPGVRGVPDRIVIYQGRVFFVELKAPGKKPRADQKLMIQKIEDQGGEVAVLSTKKEVDDFICYVDGCYLEKFYENYMWSD